MLYVNVVLIEIKIKRERRDHTGNARKPKISAKPKLCVGNRRFQRRLLCGLFARIDVLYKGDIYRVGIVCPDEFGSFSFP